LEFFKQAKEQFSKYNFGESLENNLQSLKFEALSKTATKELSDMVLVLFEDEKTRAQYFDQLYKIAELYFEKENYAKALRLFQGLFSVGPEDEIERILFFICISSAYIGEFKLSENAAAKLLYLRYKMKYLVRGLELIEHLKSFGLGDELVEEYATKFALLKKDIKAFNWSFTNLDLDIDSDKFWDFCMEVEEITKSEANDWRVSKNYLKLTLSYKISRLVKENISDSNARKEFINLIYQYKIRFPKDLFVYPLLLEYAIFYKRAKLEQAISSYLARNPNKFKKNNVVREKMLSLLNNPKIVFKKEKTVPKEEEKTKTEITLLTPTKEKSKKGFEVISEKVMIRAVDLLSDEVFEKYYTDLVACFATMEFYQAALFILEKIEKIKEGDLGIKENLNIMYLRVNFFIKEGRYHEALALVDDVVFYRPLFLKEKIGFLYLKGEALRELGRANEAKGIFKLIKEKFPNFRLVKGRLREIENLK